MIARTPTPTVLGALALWLIAGGSAACIARLDPAAAAGDDPHTTATWAGLLDAHDLAGLKIDDFEVIDHGAVVPLTNDCRR